MKSVKKKTYTIGIADTTFAIVDMGTIAMDTLRAQKEKVKVERYTVPGFKDLAVACKKLFEEYNCDICIALGMPGPMPIDKQCSHEATQGLMLTQILASKHILEVFVHMDEAKSNKELYEICKDRTRKHTMNAVALLMGKETLTPYAGTGRRQGHLDVGPLKI